MVEVLPRSGLKSLISQILGQRVFAVAGASRDHGKYGYKVYRTLKTAGYTVYPINPNAENIDGAPCYPRLENIPERIDCLVTVTPPSVTEELVRVAGHLRIPYLWMQPGSESQSAVIRAQSYGIQAISGGPCIMVAVLTYSYPH
ncbi:MAG: CoA-binding protein [Armatimonadetes bacterium]|nr:CoA-binding protein [Armatimonadota bacterium]